MTGSAGILIGPIFFRAYLGNTRYVWNLGLEGLGCPSSLPSFCFALVFSNVAVLVLEGLGSSGPTTLVFVCYMFVFLALLFSEV